MNKIFKITGWVLGLLGIVFGILAFVNEGSSVDLLLRYTYFLFFAAVVIWIGLAIFIAGRNNPKNLLKAAGVVVGVAALVVLPTCSQLEHRLLMSRHSLLHSGLN